MAIEVLRPSRKHLQLEALDNRAVLRELNEDRMNSYIKLSIIREEIKNLNETILETPRGNRTFKIIELNNKHREANFEYENAHNSFWENVVSYLRKYKGHLAQPSQLARDLYPDSDIKQSMFCAEANKQMELAYPPTLNLKRTVVKSPLSDIREEIEPYLDFTKITQSTLLASGSDFPKKRARTPDNSPEVSHQAKKTTVQQTSVCSNDDVSS